MSDELPPSFPWTPAFFPKGYEEKCIDVEQLGKRRRSVQPMLLKELVHLFWFCVIVVAAIHLFNKQFGMFWEIMNIDHKIDHLLRNRLREIVYPINCNFWFVIYIFQFLPPLPEALLLLEAPRRRHWNTGWNLWRNTQPIACTMDHPGGMAYNSIEYDWEIRQSLLHLYLLSSNFVSQQDQLKKESVLTVHCVYVSWITFTSNMIAHNQHVCTGSRPGEEADVYGILVTQGQFLLLALEQ